MAEPLHKNELAEAAIDEALDKLAWVILRMYLVEHPLPCGTGTLPSTYSDPSEKDWDPNL